MPDLPTPSPVCPVCQSDGRVPWSSSKWTIPSLPKEYGYLVCGRCRAIFCDPMPTPGDLSHFYANNFDYGWYERHLPLKKLQAMHRWRRMERIFENHGITRGNLLDIGCGHGVFVRAASRSNWNATGLDYPSAATRYAKGVLGLNIVEAELSAAVRAGELRGGQFDLITSWHCLEHTSKPIEFLTLAGTLLKPGGKLLLAVPNARAQGMKDMREKWIWCQEPFVHVVHYDGENLSQAIRVAGLKPVSWWSRDTWDANRSYDRGAEAMVRRISNRLKRFSSKLAFGFEESSRLLFYFFSCMDHWLLGHECKNGDGSELLLLAERPRED
jgi:2-polyprenyl-3-methyl-5-hydroxy-6-metoxy-1,4-benzoquinol methylase